MGGDISVALAGIDHRIIRVAAIVATPDWTRPGMRDVRGSGEILPQGEPDAYAWWSTMTSSTRCHTPAAMHTPLPSPSNAAPTTRTSRRTGRCASATPWPRRIRRPARRSA